MLPASVSALLASAPVVGFSGSRAPAPASLAAVAQAVAALPAGAVVVIGCAAGVDQAARALVPSARVLRASSFGSGRGSFAARSIACVRACAGGAWCSFPAGPAPAGLRPSSSAAACFAGFGSGSWASLALALGLGLGAVVFLPASVAPPAGWGLVGASGGWFVAQPAPLQQLALF